MVKIVKKAINIIREEGFRAFVRKALLKTASKALRVPPTACLAMPICAYELKRRAKEIGSIEEILDFAYSWCTGIIRPWQVRWEISELLKILEKHKPKVVLEIGTADGGTLFLWTRIADDDALVMSIDLPWRSGGYPPWRIPLYKAFARGKQRIHLIKADSHDPATFRKVKEILGGKKIDFLFMDGDDRYEGVKKDFETYAPLVRDGGIIAFHDIIIYPPERGVGVNRFWNEIKHNYRYIEIVEDWGEDWGGIGVLFK